ncbi:hypothetical protein BT63DRAFT_429649 [Microthyrium microscopicum]|uniref:NAD(P)-binding domain-containing protein n=1 Tax=Microthyrium microscopicum TaxID=703497 RepID=A0A6A6TXQ3_9PEZI|nr:hypothetical protein BT63DRAFT_429649 [Microthyrium microscopicum]
MSMKPTVAFFGATGGCALNTLVHALNAGYPCIAFVRTPAKLSKLLTEAPHSISQSTIDQYLTIVTGNVTDLASIKQVLVYAPALVISGVGGTPTIRPNLIRPFGLDQPTICEDTAKNIITALQEEGDNLAVKPHIVVLGSTGMPNTPNRDLPWAMYPLYKVMLHDPHADKEAMEKIVVTAAKQSPSVLAGYTVIRPSLLMDGEGKGLNKVRMGWDRHVLAPGPGGIGPAIGYGVRRADVGFWMFENLVKGDFREWNDRCVSLTY